MPANDTFTVSIQMHVKRLDDGRLKCWTEPFGLLVYGDSHSDLEAKIGEAVSMTGRALSTLPDGIDRLRQYLTIHDAVFSENIEDVDTYKRRAEVVIGV